MNRRKLLKTSASFAASSVLAGCRPEVSLDGMSENVSSFWRDLQLQKKLNQLQGGFADSALDRGHFLRDVKAHPTSFSHLNSPSNLSPIRHVGILIVGAGVAGLAAARALRLAGFDDFAILDLENTAGGNSKSAIVGGLPCPLGAHYLPLPSDHAPEVQGFLEELGLRERKSGRWVYDERHLCHSPQERLFFQGAWQEGLLPQNGIDAKTKAQYQRFSQLIARYQKKASFTLPLSSGAINAAQLELDRHTFFDWLNQQGLDDPHLHWYLDYCCRDDYGAGSQTVSAWAGVHYFASRHGFHAPSSDHFDLNASLEFESDALENGVLTWAQGNGFLTEKLHQSLPKSLVHLDSVLLKIEQSQWDVKAQVWNFAKQTIEHWTAKQAIIALPLHVASRVVANPPNWLSETASFWQHAPWVVANLHLTQPLRDKIGAAPAWDNVIYGSSGLGYVNATHQNLDPRPSPTVLTCYRALGGKPLDLLQARQTLLTEPWTHWRDTFIQELKTAHSDILDHATQMQIVRYGHAMAIPLVGVLDRLCRLPKVDSLQLQNQSTNNKRSATHSVSSVVANRRLSFAHSDWSGYSVFEEAFTRGHHTGEFSLQQLKKMR